MKKWIPFWMFCGLLLLAACGGSKQNSTGDTTTAAQVEARNKAVIPLITQIRKLPGITVQGGVPVFIKGNTTIQGGRLEEPLYVVDGIPIANSFRQVEDIVQPVDVESIRALSGAEASFYGSRGASGVILITTRRGGS
jgi:TonB-dependent SusC/RagA subfamily outer membrane receptor